jgi:HAD superfamily hydrolase (TIGR01509 family)
MSPIKGLIFDFDGLILDTEIPSFQAWQDVFARHGGALSLEAWADYVGRAPETFDPCDLLEETTGRSVDHGALRREELELEMTLILEQPILPGVVSVLDDAARLGLRLGVASSSSREWVSGHLTRLGLQERFVCLRCSDDVTRTKPAADLYVAALEALGLRPDEAVALEDSPHGVTAAQAAGIFCVAVPNDLTRSLPLDHADLHLPSLEGVRLEELLARVEAATVDRVR